MAEKAKTINDVLVQIQTELKAPKGQWNDFSKFKYRSCEDILEALKPHLKKHNATVTLTDDIVAVLDRVYIKATATLNVNQEAISVAAFARESLSKKGMDDSQITGTASSYARKYAMNGLFCIDDTKDADTGHHSEEKASAPKIDEKLKALVMEKAKSAFKTGVEFKAWRVKNELPETIKEFTNDNFKSALDLLLAEEGA